MLETGNFKQDINVIPNNMEKYLAFILYKHHVFLDSFQFMSSGIDKLLPNQPDDAFKYNSEEFKGKRIKLMTKKGVYPYDFIDSLTRFEDTSLPPKNEFYSMLKDEDITDEDYNHATNVWREFK